MNARQRRVGRASGTRRRLVLAAGLVAVAAGLALILGAPGVPYQAWSAQAFAPAVLGALVPLHLLVGRVTRRAGGRP